MSDAPGSAVRAFLILPLFASAVLAQEPPQTFRTTAEVTKAGRGSIIRTERIDLSIPNERRGDVPAPGFSLALDGLPVTRYLHELRIIARDVPSGRAGSLVITAAALRR